MRLMRESQYQKRGLQQLIELLPDNCTIAEIGSYGGESAKIFLESGKVEKIICVDIWDDRPGKEISKKIEPSFDERMNPYDGKFQKLKMISQMASELVDNRSLDFVYIDADHRYKAVKADIKYWLPKIKKGGMIGGHDYNHNKFPGVVQAVHERFIGPDYVFIDCSWLVTNITRKP